MPPKPREIYLRRVEGEKLRPVIIVSCEELNRGYYAVAVPLTSAKLETRRSLPNYVPFKAGQFGLDRDCVAQAEGITIVEKTELDLDAGPIGFLDPAVMRNLIRAIGNVIEAKCEPD